MVTVALPTAAVLAAANVIVLVVVAEAGLKLAVTPEGNPVAVNATVPVNPPSGAMVTVLVPDPP